MAPEGRGQDVVELIDETGQRQEFHLEDVFDLDGDTYYLVQAAAAGQQVLLLRQTPAGLETVVGEELDGLIARIESQEEQEGN